MRPAMICSRPASLIFRAASSERDTGSAVKSAIDTPFTFKQRLGPIHNHFRRIEIVTASQSMAFGASAVGTVEGEGTRLELRNVDATIRTCQLCGVELFLAANYCHLHESAGEFHRQAYG